MIVYEVNLDVQAAIFAEYRAWLDEHIRTMLALPGYIGADVFERRDPPPAPQQRSLCVHYRLRDDDTLDRYLREDAPRLRADGEARFGGRFSASRRILSPLPMH
jgi:antibiotic biosynthesis monooxygenase (ABM) superfamily enzyme